jgi:hypothetical protein
MSRVIGDRLPPPTAGVFMLVSPVVSVGVVSGGGGVFVGGFADDGDQDQYRGVGVGAADAEVVQLAAVAQGEFAVDGGLALGSAV